MTTPKQSHHHAFGDDKFGRRAEQLARIFGTPKYIGIQTAIVALWILLNVAAVSLQWDPYPFILLNLAFSLQAAYAAPLILLAATRQADRDKIESDLASKHRDEIAQEQGDLLKSNTDLTKQVAKLTAEIHAASCTPAPAKPKPRKRTPKKPS